jgi:hypothetical protein
MTPEKSPALSDNFLKAVSTYDLKNEMIPSRNQAEIASQSSHLNGELK